MILLYDVAHQPHQEGDVFGYTYDFGDGWAHEIQVQIYIYHYRNTHRCRWNLLFLLEIQMAM